MSHTHILVATFPGQGHINPSLQLAKKLANMGIEVTFMTSVFARKRMANAAVPNGLTFVDFSDGSDDGLRPGDDRKRYMEEMKISGLKALRNIIQASSERSRPLTCLVYSHLFAWAAEAAREFHVPSALLWIEPATVLNIYYYFFNGYDGDINACTSQIRLPQLPVLSTDDLPVFLLPSTPERFRLLMKEKLDVLDAETKPKVLVNSFDELETDALRAVEKYELIAVGPLVPSGFLHGEGLSDNSYGGDIFKLSENDYIEWLNSKPRSSVIYISFGSMFALSRMQMEEMAKGLLDCGRPFLWVIRENESDGNEEDGPKWSHFEELERIGKIVTWCSQLEVLSHPSLGCFLTHCGWNSSLESIVFGIPVVAFPQGFDQPTNAKLIEDVWKTGVRVHKNEDRGIVESNEIVKCIEEVMDDGEKSKELRKNANKWKGLAREAMEENGSSNKNLKYFLKELGHV
ncbi:anthocyanidin 3-O-glucoside 5-O-glucosyltransferase 1-like [Dorcoceras hygrometricum]|uniref:Glycosyltransferase n=1 Tax=Dorcoceras hygrometricum TaxID=472368 RepID=A0A2Z7A4C1_9LAMI|nr:anthocyanidin 3-O-glucoside 5-O-glucosyltransferase 1-like [Dorcoceras hygrometricum]